MRTTYCGSVSEALMGQTVTLMGWAHRRRDHGGVIFIDLRDREGLVQVVCDPDRAATFAIAEDVRSEYCLKVVGTVRARPEGTHNANLTSGKVELLCHELEVLNPSLAPPFQIDDENLSETTRLTHRVLDLRRPAMQRNLMLRYRVAMEVRKFLDANGFIDIETPTADAQHARGCARLPGAQPRARRAVLRAAAKPAAVQAAADGGRLRPLLPDHQVLPRRGPARRSPARVHADRHRDLVPRAKARSAPCSSR